MYIHRILISPPQHFFENCPFSTWQIFSLHRLLQKYRTKVL
ncbi:hypothetical protein M085_5199, partial [Bacteroides fragilis str. 3986 N(B)19]